MAIYNSNRRRARGAVRRAIEEAYNLWMSLPDPERAQARVDFEQRYPALTAHVKTQMARGQQIELAAVEASNPDPVDFMCYMAELSNEQMQKESSGGMIQ